MRNRLGSPRDFGRWCRFRHGADAPARDESGNGQNDRFHESLLVEWCEASGRPRVCIFAVIEITLEWLLHRFPIGVT